MSLLANIAQQIKSLDLEIIDVLSDEKKEGEDLNTASYDSNIIHRLDTALLNHFKFDMLEGPWIAGGAVMHWVQNIPVGISQPTGALHDVDVFFKSSEQFDEFCAQLKDLNKYRNVVVSQRYASKNAHTYEVHISGRGEWTIQCIKKRWFHDADDIIDHFDFRCCMIVTDGKKLKSAPGAHRDIRKRELHVVNFRPETIVKRTIKYISYGYKYTPKLIALLEAHSQEVVSDYSDTDEYDNI